MDKTLKEKIINNTFEGIDKIIETEYTILMKALIQFVEYKRATMII